MDAGQFRDFRNRQLHFTFSLVVNAVMLKAQLGQPIEGEYPGALVDTYPEIAELVKGRLKAAPTTGAPTTAIPVSKLP